MAELQPDRLKVEHSHQVLEWRDVKEDTTGYYFRALGCLFQLLNNKIINDTEKKSMIKQHNLGKTIHRDVSPS